MYNPLANPPCFPYSPVKAVPLPGVHGEAWLLP